MQQKNSTAIILAAGESSRFFPFDDSHKSMVRIMGKSIIEHTLLSLKESGIEDAVIIVGENPEIKDEISKNKDLDLNITFLVQEKATGMGDALLLAEQYIKNDFFLLSAYHMDFSKLKGLLEDKKEQDTDLVLLAKKVEDKTSLGKLGILKVEDDKVLEIVEKPLPGKEPSDLGAVGIYLLNEAFLETLRQTPKEHYSFEKAVSEYASKNSVKFVVSNMECVSLKYPWDILRIKDHVLSGIKTNISKTAKIADSAQIIGEVYIDEEAQVMENVVIKGPCYVGKNVFIGNNVVLRSGVNVEENSVIGANMEIKNTLVMANSKTHSGFIGDSVIGANCRVGAGFCTANVRLDRQTVKTTVKGEKIDTEIKSLGVMVGAGTHIGVKSSTMPGIIIGRNVVIGSGTTVMNNVDSNAKYYTKFQETVVK